MTRPAPPCPECGGARYWYGSVEFWVGGSSHSANDNLYAAVCGNCGYSGLYLQNMPGLRQAVAAMGVAPAGEDLGDAPGMLADGPQNRSEIKAFRKSVRKHKKSGSD
jgi:predicted nucleic-acid-binding Zn-ribbon protein